MRIVAIASLTLIAIVALSASTLGQTWDWAGQVATYSSTSVPMNEVSAIAVDLNENIYIAGDYGDSALIGSTKLKGIPVGDDMFLAKLNSSGQFAWAKSFGSGDVSDQVLDVTTDPDGNVYVCGYFTGQVILDTIHVNGVSISNVILAKYNSSGAVVWARLVWHANEGPGGLVFDHGHIYAAVSHTLIKFTPDGDTVWTRVAADNGSVPVAYSDIAADSSGNLYLTGEFTGLITYGATTLHAASITDRDILMVKYDSLGSVIWAKGAGGVSSPAQEDLGHGITVSNSGYVYEVGEYKGTALFEADSVKSGGATTAMFIAKYDGDGHLQWVKGGNGTTGSSSNAHNVKVLANEDILVEGLYSFRVTIADTMFTVPGGGDVLMLRLAPDGTRRWGKRSDTFAPAVWGYGLALNTAGTSAYVGGQFATSATFGPTTLTTAGNPAFDGWIGKMTISAITDAPETADGSLPRSSSLAQNYPNPFNPATTISYELPRQARVKVEIFNVLGEEIRTLINTTEPAGKHAITWDGRDDLGHSVSTGVYFYRMNAGDFSQTKKMILLK